MKFTITASTLFWVSFACVMSIAQDVISVPPKTYSLDKIPQVLIPPGNIVTPGDRVTITDSAPEFRTQSHLGKIDLLRSDGDIGQRFKPASNNYTITYHSYESDSSSSNHFRLAASVESLFGKADFRYDDYKSQLSQKRVVYAYIKYIDGSTNPKADPVFAKAPEVDPNSKTKLADFISRYGTHYVYRVTYGTIIIVRAESTKSGYNSNQEIEAKLSTSFALAKADVKAASTNIQAGGEKALSISVNATGAFKKGNADYPIKSIDHVFAFLNELEQAGPKNEADKKPTDIKQNSKETETKKSEDYKRESGPIYADLDPVHLSVHGYPEWETLLKGGKYEPTIAERLRNLEQADRLIIKEQTLDLKQHQARDQWHGMSIDFSDVLSDRFEIKKVYYCLSDITTNFHKPRWQSDLALNFKNTSINQSGRGISFNYRVLCSQFPEFFADVELRFIVIVVVKPKN
jgi:hypothetical protein